MNEAKNPIEVDRRFVIKHKLSQGGFGKVYLAYDKEKDEEVAMKVNSKDEIN